MFVRTEDLVASDSDSTRSLVRKTISRWLYTSSYMLRSNQATAGELSDDVRISTTGANAIDILNVCTETDDILTAAQAEHTARWLISSYAHADYILKNPSVFAPLFNGTNSHVSVKHKGIVSYWSLDDVVNIVGVTAKFFRQQLKDLAVVYDEYPSKLVYMLTESKLSRDFVGDVNVPTLQRAYYSVKRGNIMGSFLRSIEITDQDSHLFIHVPRFEDVGFVRWQSVLDLQKVINVCNTKPSIDEIRNQRDNVLIEQVRVQADASMMRKQLARDSFLTYWDTLKSRVRAVVPDETVSAEQFASIPLQPQGAVASRSWGIEVETVRAHLTERPAGWESEYDGSLNEGSGDCNCSCDDCDDDNHCTYTGQSCYWSEGESREFVSPILTSFNSAGLRQLCNDLPDDEDDESPGIHVHVGATDLTVTDVARLLTSYSVISPLLVPIYHRQKRDYCKEMRADNIQWWLGAARNHMKRTGRIPLPVDICDEQPADRYQDVNLHALAKHGTIEFRAMGPYYNYDHLVRWAWMVRELVNVSKLGLPQSTWTRCRSLLDVIAVLRKYGKEAPQDKQFDNINTSELVLMSEE